MTHQVFVQLGMICVLLWLWLLFHTFFYQLWFLQRASTLFGRGWWRRRTITTSMGGRRETPERGKGWAKRFHIWNQYFINLKFFWFPMRHTYWWHHISISAVKSRVWVENAENKGMEVERRSRSRERRRRGSGEYHQPQDPRLQVSFLNCSG